MAKFLALIPVRNKYIFVDLQFLVPGLAVNVSLNIRRSIYNVEKYPTMLQGLKIYNCIE